jgi:hypothetical protein
VDFDPIDFTRGREKQNIGVHRRNEKILDKVFFSRRRADLAFTAAPLRPVQGHGIALDIAFVRNRYHHVLVDDQVFNRDFLGLSDNLCAPLISELFFNLVQLLDDDSVNFPFTGKYRLQSCNQLKRVLMFLQNLIAFEAR